MRSILIKISRALRSRLARNLYLWCLLLFIVLNLNYNNEQQDHYGIIQSPLYYWFIFIGMALQMAMTYGNNLVLAPRYLRHKKYGWYILYAFTMVFAVSLVYTFGVKICARYFDVDHVQQMGFVSSPVSKDWSFSSTLDDMSTYFMGNMLWVFIFTMAWYTNEYGRQQKIIDAAKRPQVATELHFLKNQVSPHFLFNTLNNLYGLALKKNDNAPDAILKLSSILRYLLYESNSPLVSFGKEKEIMQAYIELELLRITHTEGLHFHISADKDYSIPPLLWLPVLENFFKHGTRMIEDHYMADFSFTVENNTIHIISSNSHKKATPVNGNGKAGGIGLENLQKRLALLYPGQHSITQQKEDTTYSIQVQIALA
jgi:hypothetical protein